MINSRLIKSNDAGGGVCASDITDIFEDGSGVALYQLNWDGSDMSGNYDGVATDVSFVNGHIDSAGSFNGSSSKVEANVNVFNTTTYSVSLWVNVKEYKNANYNHWAFIINNDQHLLIGEYPANTLKIYFSDFSTSNDFYTITDPTAWYNIVITRTGNSVSMYVNGTLANTFSYTGLSQGTLFKLGTNHVNNSFFNGSIDQVRIFNKAISPSEVSTLYAEAACEKTCTTDTPQIVPDCIAYYKLDGNATDSNGSGTLYDGTATNVNWTQGRFGSAGGFNGSTSKITISSMSSLGISDVRAVSGWIKTTTTAAGNMFSIGKTGSSSGYAWFQVTIESDGKLSGGYTWSNGGTKNGKKTSIVVNDGNWHNIVFVTSGDYANGGGAFYIDGQEDTNSTLFNTANGGQSTITGIATIGTYSGQSASFFNGSIDQVKIFDRAITAAEVTTLYNEVQCPSNASFNTVLYSGNGSTQNVGGVGFQPDLVWIKNRVRSNSHVLSDVIRGFDKMLSSDRTDAESSFFGTGQSLTSTNDGFSAYTPNAGYGEINYTSDNYVAWCWKAGGAAVTNTDGSITSEVSANVDAGFSIVSYTGNHTNSTVGHGLNSAPEMVIIKALNSGTANWCVYHSGIGAYGGVFLSLTNAAQYQSNLWLDTVPTSTVFSIGQSDVNVNSSGIIAYCFHSVAGFSKFGSYTGNGSATGTTVTTDFEPAFVMIKKINSTGNWVILDNKRDTSNPIDKTLNPNLSNAESTANNIDFNATTFQLKSTNADTNANTSTYIYMAFANQF